MIADDYATLGLTTDASPAEVMAAYRERSKTAHPDAGGTAQGFSALHAAYRRARDDARAAPCPACGGKGTTRLQRGFVTSTFACLACAGHPGRRWPAK